MGKIDEIHNRLAAVATDLKAIYDDMVEYSDNNPDTPTGDLVYSASVNLESAVSVVDIVVAVLPIDGKACGCGVS